MFRANDARWMRLAIAKAVEGVEAGQTPFGACIVKGENIIALEHNQVWRNTDITAHAEICAVRAACEKLKTVDLSGCVIYSTCEPCPMCFAACHWANISAIVCGGRIADARKLGFDELTVSNTLMKVLGRSPVRVRKDFLRQECLEVFSLWKSRPERKVY
ncbi:MAG: nucleoside deaminase [Candidatus Omnitrophota bacterium]